MEAPENLQFSLFHCIRFGCVFQILVVLFPRWQHSHLAPENFESTVHANEVYILQSFVRTRTDLLELKSHIIHVLKSVVSNRGLESNGLFQVNKRLKKSHLLFTSPQVLKHGSMPPH